MPGNTITIDLDEAGSVRSWDGAVLKTTDPDMGFIILVVDLPEEAVYESKKYDAFVRTNWQKRLFEHEGQVYGGQIYEEKRRHGNPDLLALVEAIIANEVPRCEIICLHGVPDESGYRCLTHDRVASAKEFAAGYCREVKAVGASEEELRSGMSRAVLRQLRRAG